MRDVEPVVVERTSRVPASAPEVWERVTTPAGIRHELRPLLSMTMPPGLRGRTLADADDLVGRPLGKAWLLLLGVLPVEYDDMSLVEVGPHHFHERSSMALLARWEHERAVTALDAGTCRVRDRLTAVPRLGLLARSPWGRRAVAAVVGALFTHRQRRLVRWAATRTPPA